MNDPITTNYYIFVNNARKDIKSIQNLTVRTFYSAATRVAFHLRQQERVHKPLGICPQTITAQLALEMLT